MQIERAIQKALIHHLAKTTFRGKVSANFNEFAREHKSMGMDVGSPDLRLEMKRGDVTYILYLELKTKKGKLSKSQKAWNEDFDANHASSNCTRAVAYGFTQAKEEIDLWMKLHAQK
jgi:hypothetical protein